MKTLILILAAFVLSSVAYSEVDEDCLVEPILSLPLEYTYYYEFLENKYNSNLDSILLDTCNSYPGNWIYYGRFYECHLKMNVFPRDTIYGYDTNYIEYTLNDLPSQYQYLFNELDSIRQIFGDFVFIDESIHSADTTEA